MVDIARNIIIKWSDQGRGGIDVVGDGQTTGGEAEVVVYCGPTPNHHHRSRRDVNNTSGSISYPHRRRSDGVHLGWWNVS